MMLRVVEREAQTLSHNQHTLAFDVDNTLKVLAVKMSCAARLNLLYNAVNHTPKGRILRCAGSIPGGPSLASRTTAGDWA
ncbi:hypothetical protein ACNKHO_02155 [Shigella flexneri]